MVTQAEFDQLLDLLRAFIRREVMPAEAGIDESDEIPPRLVEQAKEMGLYGYALPAEYGGLGLSVDQQVRLTMELGYACPPDTELAAEIAAIRKVLHEACAC